MKKYHIGYTDGVFDLFHIGHLNAIKAAKEKCDYLIVGVHSDEIVRGYKHHDTVIPEDERLAIVSALKYVDKAVLNHTRDKMELWNLYHFDCVMIGDDWKGTDRWNQFEKVLAEVGVSVEYIEYTKGISSTELKKRIMSGTTYL